MKVATIYYRGRSSANSYFVPPEGERIEFKRSRPKEVDSVEFAEWAEQKSQLKVEWSVYGEIMLKVRDHVSVSSMLEEWGYRMKQRVAKAFGIKANQSEEELDEAIKPEIEKLKDQMEH